jgi:hypothetical protein
MEWGAWVRRFPAWGLATLLIVSVAIAATMRSDLWPQRGRLRPASAHGDGIAGQAHRHKLTPLEVRTTLEKLLGHHAVLSIRMMRAEVRHTPDFTHVLRDALGANASELSAAVTALHGERAGDTFRRLWISHNIALYKYARAVASNDAEGRRKAVARLNRYRRDFGEFIETATHSALDATTVAGALKAHIDQLLRQIKAYSHRDYGKAYRLERRAFAHMFPVGKTLAGGLTSMPPGEFPHAVHNPGHELRSALTLLLGEHVELVVDATRAGLRGLPEFKFAARALNANTRDLSEAMDTIFGRRTARNFNDVWSDHIDLFVKYTIASAEGNEGAMEKTRDRLRSFPARLARFLARVTGYEHQVGALNDALGMHEDLLLRHIDAYANGDYKTAHRVAYAAYTHMASTAGQLGALIEKRARTLAPSGGLQTGGGGTG